MYVPYSLRVFLDPGHSPLEHPDYLPVYFQAAKQASAIGSGVDMIVFCVTIPVFAIVGGLSVQLLGRYCPQNYAGWACIIAGFGVLSILDENSSRAEYLGCQIPLGVGLGIVWVSTQFPILAPLPFSNSAHALAFFTFFRCFAQVRYSSTPRPSPMKPLTKRLTLHLFARAGVSSSAVRSSKPSCSPRSPPPSPPASRTGCRLRTP